MNPAAGDFHEQPGSPTIDRGSQEAGNGTTDIDGQDRVFGAETDIGADEFSQHLEEPPGSPQTSGPSTPVAPTPSGGSASAAPATTFRAVAQAAPAITDLSLKPSRFRVQTGKGTEARGGTVVAYLDSTAGTTRLTVQRRTVVVRKHRRTIVWKPVAGSLAHRDHAGANGFAFAGRIGGSALRPGSYRLTAVARDTAGHTSAAKTVAFRIVR